VNKNIPLADLPKLRDLCFSSVQAGIGALCEAGSWPRPPRARVMHIGSDYYGDDIRGIQEVLDLTELLASQEFIKTMYLRDEGKKNIYVLIEYWRRFFDNILVETDGVTLSRDVFNKWFKRFIKELYSDTSIWKAVSLINGIVLQGIRFNLDQYSTLIPVPIDSPWDWLKSIIPLHDNCFQPSKFLEDEWKGPFPTDKSSLLVTTMRIPKSKYEPSGRPDFIINSSGRSSALIAALRLSNPGSPYLYANGLFQLSHLPLIEPLGYTLRDHFRLYEKEVVISKNDYHGLRAFWQELLNTVYKEPMFVRNATSKMDIATGRFFESYYVENWFQNMLDLTIALEALFSPSDNQELSHRIALRCAWLLSNNQPESSSDRIYDRVRTMYDLRSRIVHGSSPRETDIEGWIEIISGTKYDHSQDWKLREAAIESARDIVRKALSACRLLSKLPKSGPCWPLPNNFDRNIVLTGQQKIWQRAAGILG
jgi:hypothetical protein